MPDIPADITTSQDSNIVLGRMLAHSSLAGLRTEPGSKVHKLQAPSSLEVATLYYQLQRVLEQTSVTGPAGHRASGTWLDTFVAERTPLVRNPATYAQVPVRFTGTPGTSVAQGAVLTTLGTSPLLFVLDTAVVLATTEADSTATAMAAGATSNLGAGTQLALQVPVSGISNVTTPSTPVVLAFDTETDTALIDRYLDYVHDPPNGTNPAQYRAWAREVPGVGGAAVLRPGEPDGPTGGQVDIYIVDTNMLPASQALVDAVQQYIAPARKVTLEAETFTITNANGVTTDATQTDDVGSSIKFVYSAGQQGQILTAIQASLVQAGQWTARPRIKVSSAAGATDLFYVGVWDVTTAAWAKTRNTGGVDSTVTTQANDYGLAFANTPVVQFWWNGIDTLQVQLTRLLADTTTQLWVDSVLLQSEFSSYSLEAKANAAAIVQVLPAIPIVINVVADVAITEGYDEETVLDEVVAAINGYLQSIALQADDLGGNDVVYGALGAAIQEIPGVLYYNPATYRVNGGTVNIAISRRQVAIPGTYTLTAI